MRDIVIEGHSWFLSLHIISVVCWFAALFYLPRLFVYHAMADDEIGIERFKVMERKLYRGIATPSMVATIIFGIALLSVSPDYYLGSTWFQIKVFLVAALIGYHLMCRHLMLQLRENKCAKSHIWFRWFNEV
ncbi:MAG: CopD family protein, partial [bacterium]